MTHLALVTYDENGNPTVVLDYGPIEQVEFERKFQDGADSQNDWVKLFFGFHQMAHSMGLWDESGLKNPYTVGSGVRFLLGEIEKKDKGILPKEWYSGLKGLTLKGALNMLAPFMDEGDPITIDFATQRALSDEIGKLIIKNVKRNPDLMKIPGIQNIKFLTDAESTDTE